MTTPGTEIELYRAVGAEGQGLSVFDVKLLEMAAHRKTGEQMYEELGRPDSLTPARCIQRVREITKSQDYLSVNQQKALLLLDFVKLRDILFERVSGEDIKIGRDGEPIFVESSPQWAANLIRLLKEWRETIDSMRADVDSTEALLRKAHAKAFLDTLEQMFATMMRRLQAAGFAVPDTLARSIMEEVMAVGFAELEHRTAA